jgi:hypothetical protein
MIVKCDIIKRHKTKKCVNKIILKFLTYTLDSKMAKFNKEKGCFLP